MGQRKCPLWGLNKSNGEQSEQLVSVELLETE